MGKDIYIITHTSIDEDTGDAKIVGAYSTPNIATKEMYKVIYTEFEDNKEWWEDDDDGDDYIEEQYQEWIEEQYADDERTIWTYTTDDPVEHTFKIHIAPIDIKPELQDAYAVLHTSIDGVDNQTELVGVYATQNEASLAVEGYDEDGAIENILSIYRFSFGV